MFGNKRRIDALAAAAVLRLQTFCGLIVVYCDFVGNLSHIVLNCGIDENYWGLLYELILRFQPLSSVHGKATSLRSTRYLILVLPTRPVDIEIEISRDFWVIFNFSSV